jgi:hypothetical protein
LESTSSQLVAGCIERAKAAGGAAAVLPADLGRKVD